MRDNRALPIADRVRIVSISDGVSADGSPYEEWAEVVGTAEAAGIVVITSDTPGGVPMGGCPPYKERSDPLNYTLADDLQSRVRSPSAIVVPADFRTTAGNQGPRAYAYWGSGGFSWAIPYKAGLWALGLQVNPKATWADMATALAKTASASGDGFRVVNPVGFIHEMKRGRWPRLSREQACGMLMMR